MTSSETVYALDAKKGTVIWSKALGKPDGFVVRALSAPVFDKRNLYLGLSSGDLVALDLKTGSLKWQKSFESKLNSKLSDVVGDILLLDNHIYYARFDGYLLALKLNASGQEVGFVWNEKLTANFTDTKVFSKTFFTSNLDGQIIAYDPICKKSFGKKIFSP